MTSTRTPAADAPMLAVGLMSGTSLDGIDAAIVETDGEAHIRPRGAVTVPYDDALRGRLRQALGSEARTAVIDALERDLTLAHARIVRDLLGRERHPGGPRRRRRLPRPDHPASARAAPDLADRRRGLLVRDDGHRRGRRFPQRRRRCGRAGRALGAGSSTRRSRRRWRSRSPCSISAASPMSPGSARRATSIAFDTGPGNALIDDWVLRRTGVAGRPGRRAGARRPGRRDGRSQRCSTILTSRRPRPNRSTATISIPRPWKA